MVHPRFDRKPRGPSKDTPPPIPAAPEPASLIPLVGLAIRPTAALPFHHSLCDLSSPYQPRLSRQIWTWSPGVHSRVGPGQGGKKMKDKKKTLQTQWFPACFHWWSPTTLQDNLNTPLRQHPSCQSGSMFVLQLTHQSAFRLLSV